MTAVLRTPDPTTEALVVENLGLARSIASAYWCNGRDRDDLTQVACLALVKAAERYDPETGPFSAFAGVTIRGELRNYLRDHTWRLRPSREIQEIVLALRKLGYDNGQRTREVERVRLADELGTTPELIAEALCAGDQQIGSLETMRPWEPVPTTALGPIEDSLDLWKALRTLPAEDRLLVRLYYFEDRTQLQVAEICGISQMTVSRRLARIVDSCRASMAVQEAS